MRIITLPFNPSKYSCNVYYVLGDWNRLQDVNTLIDAGTDDFVIPHIEKVSTGVGQKKVSQVLITHEHFDHKGGLKYLKERFNPIVYAFNKSELVDIQIQDGMEILVGDRKAILLHTPGHSNDSVSVYIPEEGVLFSGDLPVMIHSYKDTFTLSFLNTLEKLSQLDIRDIYPGHGNPIIGNGLQVLKRSLEFVKLSKIIQ
ncbi:MAG: MBL fold metallo-hydrolase [Bacteroidota bacterium]